MAKFTFEELQRLHTALIAAEMEDVEEFKRNINLLKDLGFDNFGPSPIVNLLFNLFKKRWIESFNYLITLQEHRDSDVLLKIVPLTRPECEYYALKLIESGANVHCRDSDKNSLLHYSVARGLTQLTKTLIEHGLDLNAGNIGGDTALHSLIIMNYPFHKRRFCALVSLLGNCLLYDSEITGNSSNLMDLLEILLWNSVDTSICNKKGHTPADLAIKVYNICKNRFDGEITEKMYSVMEILYYYTYDDIVPVHIILEMINSESALLGQVFNQIQEIAVDYDYLEYNTGWSVFSIDVEYLKKMIDRFDYVIIELLLQMNIHSFYKNSISLENFDILLQSDLADYVIEFIERIRIVQLIEIHYNTMYQKKAISEEVVMELIHYLLSYGLEVYEDDLEAVYNTFGRCELFKILLCMDIKKVFYKRDIFLCLHYNFWEIDLKSFLENPHKYSWKNVPQLLFYYTNPGLINFCREHYYNNTALMAHVEKLPEIPLLQELARNTFRTFFVDKFNIKSSKQFYSLIKHLPVSINHQKIITLQQKLYY